MPKSTCKLLSWNNFEKKLVAALFNCLVTYGNYLETIVAKLNNIPFNNSQFILPLNNLKQSILKYGEPVIKKLKIFTSTINNQHWYSTVYNLNTSYIAWDPSSNINSNNSFVEDQPNIYSYEDNNLLVKYQSFILNLMKNYQTSTNQNMLNEKDYGIVSYEDTTQYYISLF